MKGHLKFDALYSRASLTVSQGAASRAAIVKLKATPLMSLHLKFLWSHFRLGQVSIPGFGVSFVVGSGGQCQGSGERLRQFGR